MASRGPLPGLINTSSVASLASNNDIGLHTEAHDSKCISKSKRQAEMIMIEV